MPCWRFGARGLRASEHGLLLLLRAPAGLAAAAQLCHAHPPRPAPRAAAPHRYGCTLDAQLSALVGSHSAKPWAKFVTADNQHLAPQEALDLLDGLLRWVLGVVGVVGAGEAVQGCSGAAARPQGAVARRSAWAQRAGGGLCV
jgi:hypothetical protein